MTEAIFIFALCALLAAAILVGYNLGYYGAMKKHGFQKTMKDYLDKNWATEQEAYYTGIKDGYTNGVRDANRGPE